MSGLTLKNINKTFPGDQQAIRDFNLEVKDREFLILVGPTACGKSTLLRMIGGLEETVHVAIILIGPDTEAAQLELDGHVLTALRPDKGNDTGPVDVAELQGQKDGDADDDRKQDGNENHDKVGKKEALAQPPVPELHSPHLVSLNFLLVYIYTY